MANHKILTLYALAKLFINTKTPLWLGQEEGEDILSIAIHPILTIETALTLEDIDEDIAVK